MKQIEYPECKKTRIKNDTIKLISSRPMRRRDTSILKSVYFLSLIGLTDPLPMKYGNKLRTFPTA